ncbi:iron-responsive transcriptional regulator RirA [Notoacmeibacter sp. MSK16QG-6]|uniref:iron-responsive transcriptional regulator RirA n=1 Tax=Notoacmeibacter sp. MSK16QG-6 TaxID=2957982 RepID=UPI00209CC0A9|nr:iron-responsive transcriptional regulator RirA [Notoacmeibacter sp. MSK16QG-6]MCP1199780.1 iron-responsive transcriptional regulator RirA [Notoacmeibacter sp. MSK16QG-6]
MRLTRQTNYAIRMMMYCASNPEGLSRIPDIAKSAEVPELYLFKILKPLVNSGLMKTVRGRKGGVCLARPAEEITLFDIVRVTEEGFFMADCFEDGETNCPLVDHCSLNAALREALNAFLAVLSRHTLADLVKDRPEIPELFGLKVA